mmetsp:Transcript_4311/g.10611  ORF Transcript_4311/g.10611 Transcript_4311/m.10611 type:complete len:350 (+) Transcript_4311:2576-3625(+)
MSESWMLTVRASKPRFALLTLTPMTLSASIKPDRSALAGPKNCTPYMWFLKPMKPCNRPHRMPSRGYRRMPVSELDAVLPVTSRSALAVVHRSGRNASPASSDPNATLERTATAAQSEYMHTSMEAYESTCMSELEGGSREWPTRLLVMSVFMAAGPSTRTPENSVSWTTLLSTTAAATSTTFNPTLSQEWMELPRSDAVLEAMNRTPARSVCRGPMLLNSAYCTSALPSTSVMVPLLSCCALATSTDALCVLVPLTTPVMWMLRVRRPTRLRLARWRCFRGVRNVTKAPATESTTASSVWCMEYAVDVTMMRSPAFQPAGAAVSSSELAFTSASSARVPHGVTAAPTR